MNLNGIVHRLNHLDIYLQNRQISIIVLHLQQLYVSLKQLFKKQGKNKSLQKLLHKLGQENACLNLVDLEQQYQLVMNYYKNQI